MTDCMRLYIIHLILGFLKPPVNLYFTQLTWVLSSQSSSLTCLASTRTYINLWVTPSVAEKKKNNKRKTKYCNPNYVIFAFCRAVLDPTEAGKQTSHITLLIQYDAFHNAVTHKCEQKKTRVTDNKHQMVSVRSLVQSPPLIANHNR